MITVYTITYNEEILMQFMIDHYRSRFPNCNIVVYDNSSTDRTVEIAKSNNCEIRNYDSGNTLNDTLHASIKSNCWKDSNTNWVLMCDLDELLDINEQQLIEEEISGTTIIQAEGWQMVNMEDNYDIQNMKHGYRNNETAYDKHMLFDKRHITEINYTAGCHSCSPAGNIVNGKRYKMYHYKFINPDLEVAKRKETAKRLSEENRKNNQGLQCLLPEEHIRSDFHGRRGATKIRD